jgi:proteasome lid subunit RPN8/RPN11
MLNSGKARLRIDAGLIDAINDAAVQTYPNEFVAALRAEKGIINEMLMLPGTISGERSGILQLHMLPIDFSVVGSVHSHPGYSARPSEADLAFFSHFGSVHIITCLPFDRTSWSVYNLRGERIEMQVIEG